ncbi:hypothetical protein HELRODRAFT_175670 [Helobdella robusta]|uniref:Follistatin-related protein 5 n=1 Tax=Helobdella robusta TaxID=6412 RepID=T1F9I1_HELRO|nr:hypothetical protein HELRODRAFT_175670 [Helobdella robusta]ESO00687.1 hypothetical protein HELRODRAFT_175670 [Helobdella robusta]
MKFTWVIVIVVVMVIVMTMLAETTQAKSSRYFKRVKAFARRVSEMEARVDGDDDKNGGGDDDDDDKNGGGGEDDDERRNGDDDDWDYDNKEEDGGHVKRRLNKDACQGLYCRTGRICRLSRDGHPRCVCAASDFCQGHKSPVCGSDGKVYSSHCELHRVSCHEGSKLGVDHTGKLCHSLSNHTSSAKIDKIVDVAAVVDASTTAAVGEVDFGKPNNESVTTVKSTPTPRLTTIHAASNTAVINHPGTTITTTTTTSNAATATTDSQIAATTSHPTTEKNKKAKIVSPSSSLSTSSGSEFGEDKCSHLNYKHFKTNLIHYQCARTGNNGCTADHQKKTLAVTAMFDFYDRDMNKLLTREELDHVEHKDHIDRLSRFCHLTHIMLFDDLDDDEIINIDEFYRAFGGTVPLPVSSLNPPLRKRTKTHLQKLKYLHKGHSGVKESSSSSSEDAPTTFTTLVSVGNAVELKCDIPGSEAILWKRRGQLLTSSDDIKIFDDNSLYIGELRLHHMGNYSCHDAKRLDVFQTHVIIVQMPPLVRIHPAKQTHSMTSQSASIRCHVSGVPLPEVIWMKDGGQLPLQQQQPAGEKSSYALYNSNTTLEIRPVLNLANSSSSSSSNNNNIGGLFTCTARNSVGNSSATASVLFETNVPNDAKHTDSDETRQLERFAVFHNSGYTIYELTNCHIEHHVFAGFELSTVQRGHTSVDPVKTLCLNSRSCVWGDSTMAKESYLYVSQPHLRRVLVIEVVDRLNPVEVIETGLPPHQLTYIEHLDQIWMTTCNKSLYQHGDLSVKDCDEVVVMIIQQASKALKHHVVHMKNVEPPNFIIEKLFLPHHDEPLDGAFNQGYATSKSDLGYLHVIDLNSMRFVDRINLTEQKCSPQDVGYVPIGGYLFVSCKQFQESPGSNFHLVIDYITHEIFKKSDMGGGAIYVSPDSRHVVVLEEDGSGISVYKFTADGRLNHSFDEYTQLHLNDISFYRAETGIGYNAYATSYVQNTILHLELLTGKVNMIEGAEGTFTPDDIAWNRRFRKVERGGPFFGHLMTSSKNSITGLDGQKKHIQCHWQDVEKTTTISALPLVDDSGVAAGI